MRMIHLNVSNLEQGKSRIADLTSGPENGNKEETLLKENVGSGQLLFIQHGWMLP
jgi:hypothetical protein